MHLYSELKFPISLHYILRAFLWESFLELFPLSALKRIKQIHETK